MSKKTKKKKSKKKGKKAKKINHKIDLRIAKMMDFLEVDQYKVKKGKNVKSWKVMNGIPYWLYNSKKEIENKNYILNENTDLEDFRDYLNREQILILIE